MGFIYKISNNFDNNIYIGLTTKEKAIQRMYQHRYLARNLSPNDNSYLHKAMNAHGVENFSFEVIEEVENNKLPEREQYWIAYYNSIAPNGYNLTAGGEGTVGFARPQSEEERVRKGQSVKDYYQKHPEAREKASITHKEYLADHPEKIEDFKNRMAQYRLEHPDYNCGENNPFYGKHHTQETLAKIKESSKHRYKPIARLDKDSYEILETYDGIKEAEAALNVSHGWLSKAARQNKIAYEYRWKFLESVTTNSNSEISTE